MDHTYAINQDEENNETPWDHTYAKNLGVANNAISGPGKSEEEGMSGESDEVEVKVPGRRVPDLSLDEKTFILLQKSEKATYKQMVLNAPAGLQITAMMMKRKRNPSSQHFSVFSSEMRRFCRRR